MHPGGKYVLDSAHAHDMTQLFTSVHGLSDSKKMEEWLQNFTVGTLDEYDHRHLPEILRDAHSRYSRSPPEGVLPNAPQLQQELQSAARAYFQKLALSNKTSIREATKVETKENKKKKGNIIDCFLTHEVLETVTTPQ